MSEFLLDTTIFVDLFRGVAGVKDYLNTLMKIQCSIISVAELLQGAVNKKSQKKIEKFLSNVEILPITSRVGGIMLELVREYSLSYGLAIPDALIAATALEEKLTLVTSNVKHFKFIPGLRLNDWAAIKVDFESV
ncbi:hypothetical protein A2721_01690 [Candidatus Gottesmanbacteria bacterium RIFCSPHIGHO2_01_FULL_47_48]|uniref:Ribonuclease VapC n=1 Tax=Candidatus Gottesmanbacteria bacterium RIFCSPHIGHO2_01_FULL_47_48 TaxID=1798381 RepID=A0A1F6A1B9_9BACT|nr:MAG: hypothetical protein A2721_01690 [Candidatus Gottesmanbacteria bacterium RIFCSPHIGHO2_01_FULL_47_48]